MARVILISMFLASCTMGASDESGDDVAAPATAGTIYAAACHGTTTCAGTPNGVQYTVDCGTPFCSAQSCSKFPGFSVLRQPQETKTVYVVSDTELCIAYAPAPARNAGCSCELGGEAAAAATE